MIRVLGFDPSTGYRASWAHVVVDGGRRELVAGGSYRTHGAAQIECLVRNFMVSGLPLVAVEVPDPRAGVARGRAMSLLDCATTAGWIAGLALGVGLRVLTLAPEVWRQQVVGARRPSDATIARALSALLPGMGRTNAHVRDAAGVALAAALRVQGEGRVLRSGRGPTLRRLP